MPRPPATLASAEFSLSSSNSMSRLSSVMAVSGDSSGGNFGIVDLLVGVGMVVIGLYLFDTCGVALAAHPRHRR